jgi:hypothetical protein
MSKDLFPLDSREATDKMKSGGLCNFGLVEGPSSGFANPTIVNLRLEPRGLNDKGLAYLKRACPKHAGEDKFNGEWKKKTCCSIELLNRMGDAFTFIDAVYKNCPICAYNIRTMVCNVACNPNQAKAARALFDEKTHPKGTKELVQTKYVDILIRDAEAKQTHGSCADAKPSDSTDYPPPYPGYDAAKLPGAKKNDDGAGNSGDSGSGKLASGLSQATGARALTLACRGYGAKCETASEVNGQPMYAFGTKFVFRFDKDGKFQVPEENKGKELSNDLEVSSESELVNCDKDSPNGDKACAKDQCGQTTK